MGFRTVVLLNNDMRHEWENDPELGKKIAHDMFFVHDQDRFGELHNYGRVVECTHTDLQTVMIIESLHGVPVAHGCWNRNETAVQMQEKLLRQFADRLGFHLVKKPGAM